MQVLVTAAPFPLESVDALILPIAEPASLTGLLAEADRASGGALALALEGPFKGKAEQVEVLYPVRGLGAKRVVLVGLGKDVLSAETWREAVSTAAGPLDGKAASVALALPEGLDAAVAAEAAAEAFWLSNYRFEPYKTEPDKDAIHANSLTLLGAGEGLPDAAERGTAIAASVRWVRDLSNMPGNKLPVPALVAEARRLADELGLKLTVIEGPALDAQGFGCLAAVGRGSQHPPALVALEYRGGGEAAPVALVGKGITFDTGGICIKPRAGMEEMKTDMHGAATVLGTLRLAAERKLPVNLVGVLAIAENMPDDRAFKPGDVLKAYNGMTVEVVDTDAEGRLVLADAVAYAVAQHAPEAVIDLATLTGSVVMALGDEATGLFTNRDELAAELKVAGEAVGERVWRLPTWDEYQFYVTSSIADVKNAAKEKGDAIAGALFVKSFVGDRPWVHLDIAGSSWVTSDKPYRPKGSTGVGVRLLTRWLESRLAAR